MATIDVKCPHCSGVMHVEEGIEHLFCQFCGNKIELKKPVDPENLRQAKELLRQKAESGIGGPEVMSLCEKVLAIDPDDGYALLQKGYASMNINEKIDCIAKGVNCIPPEEYERYYDLLCNHLGTFIFYNDFDEWYPYSLTDIDVGFSEIMPEDTEKDNFLLDVLWKLGENIANCTDPDEIERGLDRFGLLSIVCISIFCDMRDQHGYLSDIINLLKSMRSECKYLSLESKETDEYFEYYLGYLQDLADAMVGGLEGKTEEALENTAAFWEENGVCELTVPLYEGIAVCTNVIDAGYLETVKIRRENSQAISNYVDAYFARKAPQ